MLNLGELYTTQTTQTDRALCLIEVIEQEGKTRQHRLFTDREGAASAEASDVRKVVVSSLSVRRPREIGACWLGSRLWPELKPDEFFCQSIARLARKRPKGQADRASLAVNRLCEPQSELGVHQRWYGTRPRTDAHSLLYPHEGWAFLSRDFAEKIRQFERVNWEIINPEYQTAVSIGQKIRRA